MLLRYSDFGDQYAELYLSWVWPMYKMADLHPLRLKWLGGQLYIPILQFVISDGKNKLYLISGTACGSFHVVLVNYSDN